jgi:hypothetical protein
MRNPRGASHTDPDWRRAAAFVHRATTGLATPAGFPGVAFFYTHAPAGSATVACSVEAGVPMPDRWGSRDPDVTKPPAGRAVGGFFFSVRCRGRTPRRGAHSSRLPKIPNSASSDWNTL